MMQILSSRVTMLYKRVFPVVWLAVVVATGVIAGIAAATGHRAIPAVAFVVPLIMFAIGAWMFRKLLGPIADEVRDAGDALIVRKGADEVRVCLADIINVSISPFGRPPRLTLRLRRPCRFGDEIAFIPRAAGFRIDPFARNPIAEDLIARVDRARRESP